MNSPATLQRRMQQSCGLLHRARVNRGWPTNKRTSPTGDVFLLCKDKILPLKMAAFRGRINRNQRAALVFAPRGTLWARLRGMAPQAKNLNSLWANSPADCLTGRGSAEDGPPMQKRIRCPPSPLDSALTRCYTKTVLLKSEQSKNFDDTPIPIRDRCVIFLFAERSMSTNVAEN